MFNKEELGRIVYISISVAAVVAIIYVFLLPDKPKLVDAYRGVSFGITVATFFWGIYLTYGWKLPLLNKIFYRPDVNGTWRGELISDYIDENGQSIPPIEFYIVIRQSFLKIHFTTFTNKSMAVSYAEIFSLKKDRGLKNVSYMYRKETSESLNASSQEGACELRLIVSGATIRLRGKYWSDSKTTGTIDVIRISDQKVDCFDDAKALCHE